MNFENLQELAALDAVGALDGQARDELNRLIADGDSAAAAETAGFNNVAALFAIAVSEFQNPPRGRKEEILAQITPEANASRSEDVSTNATNALAPGFNLIRGKDAGGWRQLATPGAFVKLLSLDHERGYAVVLGKLEPGARYPSHRHSGPEDVYVLQGDLHMGAHVLRAGDFHHSDAGTAHGENFSEEGCTILAVVSSPDLVAQISQG